MKLIALNRKYLNILAVSLLFGSSLNTYANPNSSANQINNFLGFCQSTGQQGHGSCPGYQAPSYPENIWYVFYYNTKTGVGGGAAWKGGKDPKFMARGAARKACIKQPDGCKRFSFVNTDEVAFGGTLKQLRAAVAIGYDTRRQHYLAVSKHTADTGTDMQYIADAAVQSCRHELNLQDCRLAYTFDN